MKIKKIIFCIGLISSVGLLHAAAPAAKNDLTKFKKELASSTQLKNALNLFLINEDVTAFMNALKPIGFQGNPAFILAVADAVDGYTAVVEKKISDLIALLKSIAQRYQGQLKMTPKTLPTYTVKRNLTQEAYKKVVLQGELKKELEKALVAYVWATEKSQGDISIFNQQNPASKLFDDYVAPYNKEWPMRFAFLDSLIAFISKWQEGYIASLDFKLQDLVEELKEQAKKTQQPEQLSPLQNRLLQPAVKTTLIENLVEYEHGYVAAKNKDAFIKRYGAAFITAAEAAVFPQTEPKKVFLSTLAQVVIGMQKSFADVFVPAINALTENMLSVSVQLMSQTYKPLSSQRFKMTKQYSAEGYAEMLQMPNSDLSSSLEQLIIKYVWAYALAVNKNTVVVQYTDDVVVNLVGAYTKSQNDQMMSIPLVMNHINTQQKNYMQSFTAAIDELVKYLKAQPK